MMITEIEDYFSMGCGRCKRFATPDCSTRRWIEGLEALREICRAAGLEEQVKWGHPCYTHAGRNIVIIGALRGYYSLGFFNAALMKDPEGVLERQGPNTKHPDVIKFTEPGAAAGMAPVIRAYLDEAKGYAEAGLKPPKDEDEPDVPEELIEAIDMDAALAEAWHALTPGRRKSYVYAVGSAKKAETRVARVEKFREKILAGKGALDR
ncbi:YdeI family protein [Pseudoroseicyclus sp. CXY001]|uniref:YdeI/OmpD-associated family protein n=1 Tax=Pseudoroseicyclus sp. CXY001 TaxID=3242492 RepID=UPI0035717577